MKQRLPAKNLFRNTIKEILPAAFILGVGVLAVPCLLVYKVLNPKSSQEPLDPSYYLLEYSDIPIASADGNKINAWWIPGVQSFACIVLAPGLRMNRSDALSLATVLHKKGFDILIYSRRGSSTSSTKSSTLGLKETGDMLSVLKFIRERPESDHVPIGIWGVDVGAYSALHAAANLPEVRVIAADNVFESIFEFLDILIYEEFGLDNRFVQLGCRQAFRLFNIASGSLAIKEIPVEKFADRSLLFIIGENRKRLGSLTTALYEKLPSKKDLISFKTSRVHLMKEKECQDYDKQVSDFFLQNMP